MSKWKKYKVRGGKHRSVLVGYKVYWGRTSMDFSFKTDDSWLWGNTNGISKVYGLSSGLHQKNSMRLGFRCIDGEMWAYAYSYADSKPCRVKLCQLLPNKEYLCNISVEDGSWVIRLDGKTVRCPFGEKKRFGFRLYPYVGGTYTLSHNWTMEIKEH